MQSLLTCSLVCHLAVNTAAKELSFHKTSVCWLVRCFVCDQDFSKNAKSDFHEI